MLVDINNSPAKSVKIENKSNAQILSERDKLRKKTIGEADYQIIASFPAFCFFDLGIDCAFNE